MRKLLLCKSYNFHLNELDAKKNAGKHFLASPQNSNFSCIFLKKSFIAEEFKAKSVATVDVVAVAVVHIRVRSHQKLPDGMLQWID